MKLILLRHGESHWNLENRFTGWTDVELTNSGKKEAKEAGKKIYDEKIQIKTIYTSILKRAIQTTEIVSGCIKFPLNKVVCDWRLNERHYGALQGLNKSETAEKFGEEQVKIWRRSFDISPPKLSPEDERHPKFNTAFSHLNKQLPTGESLRDVINRLNPFWTNYFNNVFKSGGNHLIVAHSNSLRAIIKILDKLNAKEIIDVNIPTGIPLIYQFDSSYNLLDKRFLIDNKTLKEKQSAIINQGSQKSDK